MRTAERPAGSPRIRAALEAARDALAELADAALDEVSTPAGFVRGLALQGVAFNARRRLDHLALAHGLTAAAPLTAAAE